MTKQNKFMQMYRQDPKMFREIRYLSEGSKRTASKLVDSYNSNPSKFREIVETGKHNSTLSVPEIRYYLENMGKKPRSYAEIGFFSGITLGIPSFSLVMAELYLFDSTYKSYDVTLGDAILSLWKLAAGGIAIGFSLDVCKGIKNKILGKKFRDYKDVKEEADKNLRHKRVEGTNQLEFLLD